MATEPLLGAALRVPLFLGLDSHQLAEIVNRSEKAVYQPGDTIIRQGYLSDAAVLIISGSATRIKTCGVSNHYQPVHAGTLIGEMAMLIETRHTDSVVADQQVRALLFPRLTMEHLLAERPQLADHFVRRIANRLNGLAAEMRAAEARAKPENSAAWPDTIAQQPLAPDSLQHAATNITPQSRDAHLH